MPDLPEHHLSSCYLEISRADLAHNARAVCDYVNVPVIGVVKCDGYGVSGPEAAAAWVSAGVTTLAVSDPAEALALRCAGFTDLDILLLAPVADGELLDALLDAGVILTVSGPACARFYAQRQGERPARVHVAVDTGHGPLRHPLDRHRAAAGGVPHPGTFLRGHLLPLCCLLRSWQRPDHGPAGAVFIRRLRLGEAGRPGRRPAYRQLLCRSALS